MDDIPRTTLCLSYDGVNVFDPSQMIRVYKDKVPEYIVENIRDGCESNPKGRQVSFLFLEDILLNMVYNPKNHQLVKNLFPTISDNYLLPFWKLKNPLDGPTTDATFIPRTYTNDLNWEKAKQEFYKTAAYPYDNIKILEKSVELVYERKDGKIIEGLTFFNSLDTNSKIPYIHHPRFSKRKSDFYVPKKWITDPGFYAYVNEEEVNFLSPLVQIFSGDGVQSLLLTIDLDENLEKYNWIDLPNDVIQKFLISKNVNTRGRNYFMSQLVAWKIYVSNFKKINMTIDGSKLNVTVNSETGDVESKNISEWLGNELEEKVRNTSHLEVSFEYPHVALDSNIFAEIISNTPVLCTLLLVREDRKTTHFTRYAQDKFKGTLRVWAHIQKSIIKATIEQQGRSKARSQPSLKVTLTAPNMVAVKEFAQLFGIAITIYQSRVNTEYTEFKKYIKDYPKPPKIDTKPCNMIECGANKSCPKGCGECNPVSNRCSPSITSTDWWVENYSRACQQKTRMPWLVDPNTVDELRHRGYLVKEFPKNSGQFLTCKKSKGKYDWLYLSSSTLSNSDEFPFIPCCGKEDKARLNPSSEYNKYFNNLESLNLSNGVRLELIMKGKLSKKTVKKLEDFAKDKKLQIIGVDEKSGKMLLHDLEVTPLTHSNPIGALLFTKKQKDDHVHIFLEPGHLEAEKRFYNGKNTIEDIPFDAGIGTSIKNFPEVTNIKMVTSRVKLNDDLKHQKRALIGRRGSLPDDLNRFLGMVNLKFSDVDVEWKRYGTTSQPYASFLHSLYAWSENKRISLESDLMVKTKFRNSLTSGEIYSLCAQSMSDFSQEEILDKLNPNKTTYIDPRQFHAMAEIVFQTNIVLFYRSRGSSETNMVLPYSKQGYIKSDGKYVRTVLIYQHFGTDVEKHIPVPHCELIETINNSSTDVRDPRIFEYIYQAWLNSQTMFSEEMDDVVSVPPVFFDRKVTQQIGPIGKGTGFYIKDDGRTMLISTENLPPLKIAAADDSTVVNTDAYVNKYVAQTLKAKLIKEETSDSYLLSNWLLDDFPFSTVVFLDKVSLQNIFKGNDYLAKCLKGYFMYSLSMYLMEKGIDTEVIGRRLGNLDVNRTYTLDCIYRNLIDSFIRDTLVTKRDTNRNITSVIVNSSYPPPKQIYDKGKLYINSEVFMTNNDFNTIVDRLKLAALLSMQHDLTFVTKIYQLSAVPDFFKRLSDFRVKGNEVITPTRYTYPFDLPIISRWLSKESILTSHGARLGQTVYETPLLDKGKNYFFRNNQLTGGELFRGITYEQSPENFQEIKRWFEDFGVEDLESISIAEITDENVLIPTPGDFMLLMYQHNTIKLYIAISRV